MCVGGGGYRLLPVARRACSLPGAVRRVPRIKGLTGVRTRTRTTHTQTGRDTRSLITLLITHTHRDVGEGEEGGEGGGKRRGK